VKQQIRYCTTVDGARIAYAVTGRGSPIIRTSHWLTHLEHDFTDSIWNHVMLGLNQRHTLIRYDPRGQGMSQRDRTDIDFDAWMEDLEAVAAATGFPRFTLFGASQGAATAIAYAARHPERVDRLIIYGGFARGMLRDADEVSLQKFELAKSLIRQGWGVDHDAHRQWFSTRFLPDGTAEQHRAYNRLQKVSSTAETAVLHLEASGRVDVSARLPEVTAPTLVLHCRDDTIVPFEWGQEIAATIPGAKLVALEGRNHLFQAGSSAHRAFFDAVNAFLGDKPMKRLPGEDGLIGVLEARGRSIDQNGLIKLILLVLAVVGAVLSVVQVWQAAGG
jgi:pimeloyl-ACP methyl ester carboxylesterase